MNVAGSLPQSSARTEGPASPGAADLPKVLDVGNCRPDHFAIQRLVSELGGSVDQAHTLEDALSALQVVPYRLVLVNRKLDHDYSDGVDVIRAIRKRAQFDQIRVILISNYPEAQSEAVSAGAERGFGKLALGAPATRALIKSALKRT